MELTPKQAAVAKALVKAVKTGQRGEACSGPGGVGKTVVAAAVAGALVEEGFYPIPSAMTGKATSRFQQALTRQGIELEARTLSSICERVIDTDQGPVFTAKAANLPDNAALLVDEFSMVGKRYLLKKLLPAVDGVPILGFGDHFQLPPVMDEDNPILSRTQLHLTEILRQGQDSGIVDLSLGFRNGILDVYNRHGVENKRGILTYQAPDVNICPTVSFERSAAALFTYPELVTSPILVGTNDLRRQVNRVARMRFGFAGPPKEGETLRIERNNPAVKLFNGDQVRVESIDRVEEEDGELASLVKLEGRDEMVWVPHNAQGQEVWAREDGVIEWDYGYATTIHKAQGSEWDHVRVLLDPHLCSISTSLPGRRMLYTAVTRAAKLLDVFVYDYEYNRARARMINRMKAAARSRARPRKGLKARKQKKSNIKSRLKDLQ